MESTCIITLPYPGSSSTSNSQSELISYGSCQHRCRHPRCKETTVLSTTFWNLLHNLLHHPHFNIKLLDVTHARTPRAVYAGEISGACWRGIDISGLSCRIGFIAPSCVQVVRIGATGSKS